MISVQKSVAKKSDFLEQVGREASKQSARRAAPNPVLELQQTLGNQAVLQLLRSQPLQAKLAINKPGDIYEQEADRIADQIVPSSAQSPAVQRKCACGGTPGPSGECEECRKKRLSLQRKASSFQPPGNSSAPSIVHEVL